MQLTLHRKIKGNGVVGFYGIVSDVLGGMEKRQGGVRSGIQSTFQGLLEIRRKRAERSGEPTISLPIVAKKCSPNLQVALRGFDPLYLIPKVLDYQGQ
jgi:hypothetical protein